MTNGDMQLTGRLVRPARLAQSVAEILRDNILSGQLRAGTPLLQERLAENLGVSRTPLREALRIIEQEGLVRLSRGNSVEVITVGADEAIALYQVREVVDGLAARLTAQRPPVLWRPQAQEMVETLDLMAESVKDWNPSVFLVQNARFHWLMLQAAGNKYLEREATLVRMSSLMLFPHMEQNQARIREANDEHQSIYRAVTGGDPVAAERLARDHIRTAAQFWEGLLNSGQRTRKPHHSRSKASEIDVAR